MKKIVHKQASVSIVIPNWNGKHLLEKNLPSVIDAAHGAQLIIADDASGDDSISYVRLRYPEIVIVPSTKQQGFAGNVNAGVAAATGDVVVLLNTDVRPEINFLAPLLVHFDDPSVFAVGCLEKSYESGKIILRGRGVAHWEKGFFVHARGEVDRSDTAWVSGGSSAYRRFLWNQFGGMDVLYNPYYWEDIDLSYQAKKSGYQVLFEKKSIVGHFHEEGKIKIAYTPSQVKQIVYRNQFIFLWKNISNLRLLVAHICWAPVRLFQAFVSGDLLMISGYVAACARLSGIFRSRLAASRFWRKDDLDIVSS